MALTEDFWLTDDGSFLMGGSEHSAFAVAYMLDMPKDSRVPQWWIIKGIPEIELQKALERGADPKAVEFLSTKKNDARLYAMREYGWVRTARNKWNLWDFDDETAEVVRDNSGYWKFQADQHRMTEYEMADIYEFKDGCQYSISIKKLLDGGKPRILKKLAMGNIECGVEEPVEVPQYSTAKYSEVERDRLYGRTGANPKRRLRR